MKGIIALALIFWALYAWLKALADDEDKEKNAIWRKCYGCPCGWCDLDPDGPECRERRQKSERGRYRGQETEEGQDERGVQGIPQGDSEEQPEEEKDAGKEERALSDLRMEKS